MLLNRHATQNNARFASEGVLQTRVRRILRPIWGKALDGGADVRQRSLRSNDCKIKDFSSKPRLASSWAIKARGRGSGDRDLERGR